MDDGIDIGERVKGAMALMGSADKDANSLILAALAECVQQTHTDLQALDDQCLRTINALIDFVEAQQGHIVKLQERVEALEKKQWQTTQTSAPGIGTRNTER